ncbi:MAG: hypothetical protein IJS22_04500 [Lachnospiraceae bacterium]|nr:hypothetical protein [Lachnospiraceae bacterium]
MKQKVELYPEGEKSRLKRKTKVWTIITAAAAALVLVCCITLCALADTVNAARMERICCLVSGAGGCAVIFLYTHFVLGSRRMARHLDTLQDEEIQAVSGRVTMAPGRIAISGSITVRTLHVAPEKSPERAGVNDDPTGKDSSAAKRVSISAEKVRLLPPLPARLTLYTVHGYAVSYEVHDETD